jgi:hypothetical protein
MVGDVSGRASEEGCQAGRVGRLVERAVTSPNVV